MIPKVSIITITYNAAQYIEATLQSVVEQTYPNIEYIIIDGDSTDNTLEIAHRYAPRINTIICEPDSGLYDAMNKGLDVATGDYLWFMNAGDTIYAKDTLQKAIEVGQGKDVDIYYGETMMVSEAGDKLGTRSEYTPHQLPEKLGWRTMRHGMVVCHQSIIVRKSIAPKFEEKKHPYSADVDWVIKCLKASKETLNTQSILSNYLAGGYSVQNHRASLKDRYAVLENHFGVIPNLFNHLYISARLFKRKYL